MREQKGITLVALVITIIILLILAGVGISMALGQGGLFDNAQRAVNEYNNKAAEENQIIDYYSNYIEEQFNKIDSEAENNTAE